MQTIRKWVQVIWTFLVNGYWAFPFTGTLYQGPLKILCSPGLNCFSCPAATTFCPIGSLQQLLASIRFSLETGSYYFGTYVIGWMGIFAASFGRFICGWACPFGLFQELLHKIPSRKISIPRILTKAKYLFLLFFVVLLPLLVVDQFDMGSPWFCKFVCPAGTLTAGIPMLLLKPELRSAIGLLFWNKFFIMIGFILWSVFASRPFCRTTCPLGAFYAMFNRFSLVQLELDKEACIGCEACHRVCPVENKFNETPASGECIRCMRCASDACQQGAIYISIAGQGRRVLNGSKSSEITQ